jgi:hypothetical protein
MNRFVGYFANGDSLVRSLKGISGATLNLIRNDGTVVDLRKAVVSGATAQDNTVFRVGGHGAYSSGGDVQKPKFAFGAQVQLSLSRHFAFELDASRYSDKYEEEGVSEDMHVTTVGLSLVMTIAGSEPLSLYGLGGLDYNVPSMEVTYPPYDVEVHVQNQIGYHVGGGLRSTAAATKNLEGFIEYRYTFLNLTGEMTVSRGGSPLGSADLGGSSNFGLIKFGVNCRF